MKFQSANSNQNQKILFNNGNIGNKINFKTSLSDPWSSVLNSSYGSNIVAAYDFSEGNTSTIPAKIGPELPVYGPIAFSSFGAEFTRNTGDEIICSTFADDVISITYPCTLMYVGKTINNLDPERIVMSVQPVKYIQTSSTNTLIFSRNEGLLPFNGVDNQYINYAPDGTEWYFIAISFETDGVSRYAIRKSSGNLNGTVTTQVNPQNFNGYIGFGAGLSSELDFNFDGTLKLAMVINQSFSTEADMNNLFNTLINGGPVSDLELQ